MAAAWARAEMWWSQCGGRTDRAGVPSQGVRATHPVEGDLSVYVEACAPGSRFADVGLEGCGLDTATVGETLLTFRLADAAAGVTVQAVRKIVVHPVCSSGEVLCSTLACAAAGVCLSGVPLDVAPANSAPLLRLADGDAAVKYAARGAAYGPCLTEPRSSCTAAPVAFDPQDGDLAGSVLACPPDECLEFGCPGHEFRKKGVPAGTQRVPSA